MAYNIKTRKFIVKEQKPKQLYELKPSVKYNQETGENAYSWKKKDDPSYTIEVNSFVDEEENKVVWYVYHAKDGKGIENSPDIFENEKEAKEQAMIYVREE